MRAWRIKDYPARVKVKDAYYRIVWVRDIPGYPTGELAGCCCSATKTIWIALGQSPEERAQTVAHELAHAIDFEYGLKLPHRLIYKLEAPLVDLFTSLELGSVAGGKVGH